MGDELFWAIRGGGGGSFGIVLSFKVRLVPVPPKVTFISVTKNMEQGAVDAVTKWQTVAPALPDDLTVRVDVQQRRQAIFQSLYLGNCSAAVRTLRRRLPELGVTRADCREMSWLQYVAYINFGDASNTTPLDVLLLNRSMTLGPFVKNKSDYVKKALTKNTWEIFTWPSGAAEGLLILEPQGGKMGSIADNDTPFPHRSGVLYNIQYVEFWNAGGNSSSGTPSWISDMYDFMAPFVSNNPKAAYANYRDLDLGVNKVVGGVSTYESGKVWGERYFGGNFRRLAMIKRKVDPADFFRNEQSVPPLLLIRK